MYSLSRRPSLAHCSPIGMTGLGHSIVPHSWQTQFSARPNLCSPVSSNHPAPGRTHVHILRLIHVAQGTGHTSQALCPTTSYSLTIISSQRVDFPPPQSSHFSLVRWPISQDPFPFKMFSNLPWCDTRKRQASVYPNILLPCNSRVATPSRTSITFCKIKQRTSNKVKGSPRP